MMVILIVSLSSVLWREQLSLLFLLISRPLYLVQPLSVLPATGVGEGGGEGGLIYIALLLFLIKNAH